MARNGSLPLAKLELGHFRALRLRWDLNLREL